MRERERERERESEREREREKRTEDKLETQKFSFLFPHKLRESAMVSQVLK